MKHTSGPYSIRESRAGATRVEGKPDRWFVCAPGVDTVALFAAEADAHLFIAAPDLLALAVRTTAHFADTDNPLGADARAILAKAAGEESAVTS